MHIGIALAGHNVPTQLVRDVVANNLNGKVQQLPVGRFNRFFRNMGYRNNGVTRLKVNKAPIAFSGCLLALF